MKRKQHGDSVPSKMSFLSFTLSTPAKPTEGKDRQKQREIKGESRKQAPVVPPCRGCSSGGFGDVEGPAVKSGASWGVLPAHVLILSHPLRHAAEEGHQRGAEPVLEPYPGLSKATAPLHTHSSSSSPHSPRALANVSLLLFNPLNPLLSSSFPSSRAPPNPRVVGASSKAGLCEMLSKETLEKK